MINADDCNHYNRNCSFVTKCCNLVFPCRLCHDLYFEDKPSSHKLDRHKLDEIICRECDTKQSVSNKCINCDVIFGLYFCGICNLFDNDITKQQYHCDKCGICRVGGKENMFHCDTCNACLSNTIKDTHKCIKNTFHNECPICLDTIFDSVKSITILKCGHTLHLECLNSLLKTNSLTGMRCPLCNKSTIDTKILTEFLDKEVENTPMPKDLVKDVDILCNDCNKTSNTNYHIVGMKCLHCLSYNTSLC